MCVRGNTDIINFSLSFAGEEGAVTSHAYCSCLHGSPGGNVINIFLIYYLLLPPTCLPSAANQSDYFYDVPSAIGTSIKDEVARQLSLYVTSGHPRPG